MTEKPALILLVEDNFDHAELIRRGFEENLVNCRIHHVPDGEEALDYLFRRGKYAAPGAAPSPRLILLDLRLPRIDGLEVLKAIKDEESTRKIPVVILTSSEAEKDVGQAYSKFANSYLVKPVEFAKFKELIEELELYWLGWNVIPGEE